jgi:hypothetical protein
VSETAQIPSAPRWFKHYYPDVPADFQVRFEKGGKLLWASNPGPQTWALCCPFDEILLGGARGGGKSAGLIGWMAMGDPTLPADDPARYSFLNDPDFRGLLLREEYQSMAEFVEEAVEFYRPFGGKPTGNPVVIDFSGGKGKSGSKIYFNHLGDEEAYNKYRGWNLTKIGAEELTQIETLRRYLKLFGSLRSVERLRTVKVNGKDVQKRFPRLRTQMMNTTNPDGPGAAWVKARFVEVYSNGKLIPWNEMMRDPISKLTRIFIPAGIKDNPFLRDDQKYMGNLLSQDEVTQAQWIHGDWNAGSGVYFRDYRPDGPRGEQESTEFPQARHRIDSAPLQPWWFRWGGGDWGYQHNAVFHKFCRNEHDKRIHVYDELAVRQTGSFELGVMLAKWWMPELESLPDHRITIALSPDAFSKTDASKTKAEQIEAGIKEVLGPYGAMLLRYNEDEKAAMARDPKAAAMMFELRKRDMEGKMCIALMPANNDRVAGWSYLRDLLRFRPALKDLTPDPNYLKHVLETRGIEAYELAAVHARDARPEVLPKIQIWRTCRTLDAFLRVAMHDDAPRAEDVRKFDAEDGVGGDDGGDCLIAGTLVRTDLGLMPIELIRAGDLVWTRAGLREVKWARMVHQSADVFRADFSDGSHLIGTANHGVYVQNVGFKFLDSLRYGDMVEVWQNQSFSTESPIADIQNQNTSICADTFGAAETTGNVDLVHSIATFGSSVTEQSQADATYTTATGTPSTTISRTWNASQSSSITANTAHLKGGKPQESDCENSATSLKNGTHPKPESSGTPRTGNAPSPPVRLRKLNASNAVAPSILKSPPTPDSAKTVANPLGVGKMALTTWKRIASVAGGLLSRIGMRKSGSARVHVVRVQSWGTASVHDLGVSQNPEYFANGILVHNSARYGLMQYKAVETTIPLSYWVNERVDQFQQQHVQNFGEGITDPTRLAMIYQRQSALYGRNNQSQAGTFTARRASVSRVQ